MRRKIHKCLSFLLAAVLLASLAAPAALAAEGGDTVFVRTAEDLVQLAENCTLDSWSQGRIVRLEADIDLSGTDFTPIPTFGGTFEGQGHHFRSVHHGQRQCPGTVPVHTALRRSAGSVGGGTGRSL